MSDESKLKVYPETSFVSYLTGGMTTNAKIATDQAYTHQWRECEKKKVLLFISGYTAAVNGMDILLTWNCKHMANPHTLPKTGKIIADAGFFCPAIMTPKTFIENTEMEVDHV